MLSSDHETQTVLQLFGGITLRTGGITNTHIFGNYTQYMIKLQNMEDLP